MLDVPYLPPAHPADDRSGRFIATGVILVLVAVLTGCVTAMLPVTVVLQHQAAQQAAAMRASSPPGTVHSTMTANASVPQFGPLLVGGLLYLAFTVTAGWIGVAAFLKRRYVRPLVLIFSTHGLIVGILTALAFAIFLPIEWPQIAGAQSPTSRGMMIGIAASLIVSSLFMIGIPLTLLILMKPDAVRETAEHYDLRRRWTDGVPIKLLGLVLTLAVFAFFDLISLHQAALPMIVTVLKGPAVIFLYVLHAVAMATAAVLVYRRQMAGWTLALLGLTVPAALFCLSSVLLPSEQFLAISNADANALDLAKRHEAMFRIVWTLTSLAFLIATVIYLRRMRPLVRPPLATLASE